MVNAVPPYAMAAVESKKRKREDDDSVTVDITQNVAWAVDQLYLSHPDRTNHVAFVRFDDATDSNGGLDDATGLRSGRMAKETWTVIMQTNFGSYWMIQQEWPKEVKRDELVFEQAFDGLEDRCDEGGDPDDLHQGPGIVANLIEKLGFWCVLLHDSDNQYQYREDKDKGWTWHDGQVTWNRRSERPSNPPKHEIPLVKLTLTTAIDESPCKKCKLTALPTT